MYEKEISQVPSEIAGLIDIVKRENVRSFLEIGSRYGGSLWKIANAMPVGSKIVSCDSGLGMGGRKEGATDSLKACIAKLIEIGYDAHLIVGNSQKQKFVDQVAKRAPFDCVFIDGDHEYPGVTKDWLNYGPMARIVAFHDVGWIKPKVYLNPKVVEVPRLWKELKDQYPSEEFIDYSTGATMGIGVLWRDGMSTDVTP